MEAARYFIQPKNKAKSILKESYSKSTQQIRDTDRKKNHEVQEKEIISLALGIE